MTMCLKSIVVTAICRRKTRARKCSYFCYVHGRMVLLVVLFVFFMCNLEDLQAPFLLRPCGFLSLVFLFWYFVWVFDFNTTWYLANYAVGVNTCQRILQILANKYYSGKWKFWKQISCAMCNVWKRNPNSKIQAKYCFFFVDSFELSWEKQNMKDFEDGLKQSIHEQAGQRQWF